MVDGEVLWFGAIGLANGLAVIGDEGTRSAWDHITGESFEGKYRGNTLETWPIRLTTVQALLAEAPDTLVIKSDYRSIKSTLFKAVAGRSKKIDGRGLIPPGFRSTMATEIDPRLPELTQGLGVIDGDRGRFYPMRAVSKGDAIEDEWNGRRLRVERGAIDGVLSARWSDDGSLPMQLLSRWYGFSFTYPGCGIYRVGD